MRKNSLGSVLYRIVLWLVAIVFFLPVLWIILGSLKTKDQLLATPPAWVFTPTLANFVDLFTRPNIVGYLTHSLVISAVSVAIAIVVSFLAAYSFSRFQPRGTNFLMFLLLSMRMTPAAAVVIPIYLMYVAFGWKDTWFGMIMFYAMFSIPFSVWILKGFVDGVSPRFDETGLINGGSRLHVLLSVVLPQVRPGLIAAFIFNMVFVWNEFLFNYLIGGKITTMVPVALSTLMYSGGGIDWTFVAALTVVFMLPPIVVVFFFQKYLLTGMTFGTVRGEV
jgi:multiple sugar transport system permease protein